MWCGACNDKVPNFVALVAPMETVDYVSRGPRGPGNTYGNTYNPRWRNHPNCLWNQGPQQQKPLPPQGNQYQPAQQHEKKYTTEDVLAKFMINTEAKF